MKIIWLIEIKLKHMNKGYVAYLVDVLILC